ncbi:hypothetical protein Tco_1231970 [Tanacetum coccineum]
MTKPPLKPCFIYDGSYWTRDCPSRKAINALVAEMNSITKEPPQRELGSIKHLGTLREILTKAKTKDQGLLFTKLIVNDKKMLGLIDNDATHNFLDVKEAERLRAWISLKKPEIFLYPATKTLVIHDNGVSQVTTLKRQTKIQPLLSATQFKKAARERECLLATMRKSFDDETPTHPRPPRLFQKNKEWHEEANETRTCLDNAVKRIKKLAENKQRRNPRYKEYSVNWK